MVAWAALRHIGDDPTQGESMSNSAAAPRALRAGRVVRRIAGRVARNPRAAAMVLVLFVASRSPGDASDRFCPDDFSVDHLVLPSAGAPGIDVAEFWMFRPEPASQGEDPSAGSGRLAGDAAAPDFAFVLLAGQNQDAREYLRADSGWWDVARRRGAGVVAVRFVSPDSILRAGGGYFDAGRGSGGLLVGALDRAGLGMARLALFGFSGGAHFVDSFALRYPDRVAAWCAYSARWWLGPEMAVRGARGSDSGARPLPPGIVACGERDEDRIQASLSHYQALRRLGHPVLWLRVAGAGHQLSGRIEAFARDFFDAALDAPSADPALADISTRQLLTENNRTSDPSLITQLPCKRLHSAWCSLHSP